VALDLIAKGHSSHYQDRFVDEVLARVRESIESGQLEPGAASIDEALAALDQREAIEREAAKRRRVQLLEAAEEQALLLRDPQRVADAIQKLVSLDHPQRTAARKPFGDKLNAYYDEGKTRGLRLPLEVAEALARRRLAQASGSDERGEALMWLGVTLLTLGERESGAERLQQAVQAYEAALEEYTRERVPLAWATTQNNLGNALSTLGQRESGTDRLQQAVQAFEAALEVFTRESAPRHFEIVRPNLAEAQRLLLVRQQVNPA
jgi:tetratricopeptide (TPR) repeat protein